MQRIYTVTCIALPAICTRIAPYVPIREVVLHSL